MIDGSTLEICLQTSEPRLSTLFFKPAFSVRQDCSILNVGFELLLRLFSCAPLNIVLPISIVSDPNSLNADHVILLNTDPDL
jgi:hypothetical protein